MMTVEDIAKIHRDTPKLRNQYDLERFRKLATDPVIAPSAFSPFSEQHLSSTRLGLPKLEEREFGGIAAAYGVRVDAWMPTILEPHAFQKSLEDKVIRNRVRVLYQHYQPIGMPTFMADLAEGLAVVGKVSKTATGDEALTLTRDGVISEMSVGFMPTEYYFKEIEGETWRYITEGELYEFSLVTRGANRGAKITDVNSAAAFAPLATRIEVALAAFEQRLGAAPNAVTAEAVEGWVAKLSAEEFEGFLARLRAARPAPKPTPMDMTAQLAQLADLERQIAAGGIGS